MDLHVNSKFWFLSTPPHPSIPYPSPTSKQKEVCLANLSDILVGSKNNLLHGLGRNLESFLESDAHHSSLVNKKKKTLYLLYFNWYSRLPITRKKRNKQDNSFPNITLSDCWLMLLSKSPTRQRPILKSGRNNNNNYKKNKNGALHARKVCFLSRLMTKPRETFRKYSLSTNLPKSYQWNPVNIVNTRNRGGVCVF